MKKCIGMILVAAMLMLAGAAFAEGHGGNMGGMPPMQGGPQQENQPQQQASESLHEYEQQVEQRLSDILSSIDGIGIFTSIKSFHVNVSLAEPHE